MGAHLGMMGDAHLFRAMNGQNDVVPPTMVCLVARYMTHPH
jgi:hypothetical protein